MKPSKFPLQTIELNVTAEKIQEIEKHLTSKKGYRKASMYIHEQSCLFPATSLNN